MTPADDRSWVGHAHAAAHGGAPAPDIEVMIGRLPPIADGTSFRATGTVVVTAVAWGWVATGALASFGPLSPMLLLAHLVLLALTIRVVFGVRLLFDRLRLAARARRHRLVLTPQGLLLERPGGHLAAPLEDIVDIRERGDWRQRKGGRRYAEVFLVLVPEGGAPRWIALPPVFERTPGVLAERLMRWRGPATAPEDVVYPEPARLASRVYEEAAAGHAPPGGVVIRHGYGWLRRGPYATVLLGAVLVEQAVRLPAGTWLHIGIGYLLGIGACLAAVPLFWMFLQRRHVAPRKGLALVLTPAEVLIRIRSGILRATWRGLAHVHVEVRSSWSVLEGQHAARVLVLDRGNAPPIRYEEAFLGLPAEVAQGLCEAYRRGVLPV